VTDLADDTVQWQDFDPEALRKKYREERDKRLRADGNDQYIHLTGRLAKFAEDPYVAAPMQRPALTDIVDVAIVGAGFAGLIMGARLRQAGVRSIRLIEKGGDVGGTWYWNRYPGVRCDIESYIYMPLLEETGFVPSEKYARGDEIFAHAQGIAREFDLYSNACLETQVTSIDWDEQEQCWVISTDRDDRMRARFVCLGGGIMHRAKLPGVPGIETFEGHAFHTSRWDYDFTGGDMRGGLEGLRGKRVAVVGTGATAIQVVPAVVDWVEELYVFQRTPSSVDERNNRPTDVSWFTSQPQGWQKRRRDNFTAIVTGMAEDEDLVNDRWTDVWRRLSVVAAAGPQSAGADAAAQVQAADFAKMEEIRARISAVVEDPATAEALKPWYNQFCKRPLYSDEYLQKFNRPNVHLVDTDGRGVESIDAHAVHAGGKSYSVDAIIFATGFDVGIPAFESGEYDIKGRDGMSLTEHWREGVTSLHGIMTRGFPNLFLVGNRSHAGRTVNVTHILDEQAQHIAAILGRCLKSGVATIEPTQQAEEGWDLTMRAKAVDRREFEKECTPGYFNNEGKVDDAHASVISETYGGGPMEYIALCRDWLATGLTDDMAITLRDRQHA
jgi:cation diffusion facilitator CzcD-associated flavoprotein CzcO